LDEVMGSSLVRHDGNLSVLSNEDKSTQAKSQKELRFFSQNRLLPQLFLRRIVAIFLLTFSKIYSISTVKSPPLFINLKF